MRVFGGHPQTPGRGAPLHPLAKGYRRYWGYPKRPPESAPAPPYWVGRIGWGHPQAPGRVTPAPFFLRRFEMNKVSTSARLVLVLLALCMNGWTGGVWAQVGGGDPLTPRS